MFDKQTSPYRISKWLISVALAMSILAVLTLSRVQAAADYSIKSLVTEYNTISVEGLISLTNQARMDNGLQALTVNQDLAEAAMAKAEDMKEKGYFDHYRPQDGKTPWSFIESAGYDWRLAGENLARGYRTNNHIVQAWLESPSHRENILSKKYQETGVAIVMGDKDGQRAMLTVQMFGSK